MITDLDDLWIGDRILVKSVGEVGTFEKKVNENTAIIKFNIGTSEIHIEDMELAGDKSEKKGKPVNEDTPFDIWDRANFKNEIDLHFEKLAPGKSKSEFGSVLNFQLEMCEKFIEKAIEYKEKEITIIHGKGNGILRAEVVNLLKNYKEHIYWNFEGENKGGAVIVMLKPQKV